MLKIILTEVTARTILRIPDCNADVERYLSVNKIFESQGYRKLSSFLCHKNLLQTIYKLQKFSCFLNENLCEMLRIKKEKADKIKGTNLWHNVWLNLQKL